MVADLRVCALIPTYDNPRTIRAVVAAVARHVPDVLVVDDGSAVAGREACAALADEGLVELVRLDENSGKGVACLRGFERARELGFTHAFQVDADGQHDIDAMPRFLEIARRQPGAAVLGSPVYDDDAPRVRRVARHITSFWVGLEVGDFSAIADAMVGFRIYPVDATLACRPCSRRMDFDVEIAVLLFRAGVPIVNEPVAVRYLADHEGGISHFRPVVDNMRMCVLHTRLCIAGSFGWLGERFRR